MSLNFFPKRKILDTTFSLSNKQQLTFIRGFYQIVSVLDRCNCVAISLYVRTWKQHFKNLKWLCYDKQHLFIIQISLKKLITAEQLNMKKKILFSVVEFIWRIYIHQFCSAHFIDGLVEFDERYVAV